MAKSINLKIYKFVKIKFFSNESLSDEHLKMLTVE